MTLKYRIGIMPGPWPAGREGAAFLWTLCDQLERSDVDSIWLSDRLSSPVPVPEVMTTLAAIAARTTRLKFGPSVVVLPYRTPVVAAKEMATVDWLSQGRLFPAVGVGVELPREFEASGVAFAERGRLGDGWIPSFITPEELRVGVQKVQDLAMAAGRQVPEDHFGTLINYAIADTEEAALAMAQPYIPRGRVDEATMRQCTAFGPVDRLVDRVEEYVKAGASKFILRPLCPPDRMLDQLARMAERVCPEYHRR